MTLLLEPLLFSYILMIIVIICYNGSIVVVKTLLLLPTQTQTQTTHQPSLLEAPGDGCRSCSACVFKLLTKTNQPMLGASRTLVPQTKLCHFAPLNGRRGKMAELVSKVTSFVPQTLLLLFLLGFWCCCWCIHCCCCCTF